MKKAKIDSSNPDIYYIMEFYSKFPGFAPTDIKKWYSEVLECHKDMEPFSGVLKIDLGKLAIDKKAYILENFGKELESINTFNKEYFKKYSIKPIDLFIENKNTYSVNDFIRQTNKVVSYGRYYYDIIYKINSSTNNISELKEKELYIGLLIDPIAFLKLGHYSIDSGSCFGQAGQHNDHKFILSKVKNSFVILGSREEIKSSRSINETIDNGIIFRAWGIVNRNHVKISNIYSGKLSHVSILDIIKTQLQTVFKVNLIHKTIENKDIYEVNKILKNLYTNTEYIDTFIPKEKMNMKILELFEKSVKDEIVSGF